jgi:putative transcriptional regulator
MANEEANWGTELRRRRRERELTQAQLADKVGVSRQTINYIEQGTYCPSTKLALQLARAMDTTVDALFYLEEGT